MVFALTSRLYFNGIIFKAAFPQSDAHRNADELPISKHDTWTHVAVVQNDIYPGLLECLIKFFCCIHYRLILLSRKSTNHHRSEERRVGKECRSRGTPYP